MRIGPPIRLGVVFVLILIAASAFLFSFAAAQETTRAGNELLTSYRIDQLEKKVASMEEIERYVRSIAAFVDFMKWLVGISIPVFVALGGWMWKKMSSISASVSATKQSCDSFTDSIEAAKREGHRAQDVARGAKHEILNVLGAPMVELLEDSGMGDKAKSLKERIARSQHEAAIA